MKRAAALIGLILTFVVGSFLALDELLGINALTYNYGKLGLTQFDILFNHWYLGAAMMIISGWAIIELQKRGR